MSPGEDAHNSEPGAPKREVEYVVVAPGTFEEEALETAVETLGENRSTFVDGPEDLPEKPVERGRVVLYRYGHEVEFVRELVETLEEGAGRSAAVCVIDDGASQAATTSLREGASDYVFVRQLQSPNLEAALCAALDRHRASERDRRVQRELEERSSELLGVNALANGVSNVLDRDIIVRRGLWVLAGVCEQDSAAMLEIRPRPTTDEDANSDESAEEHLARTATFSTGDHPIVDERVDLDRSWRNIIEENYVAILEGEPDEDVFPGLSPFWSESPEGKLTLVPVRASQSAIGALVLADIDGDGDLAVSRDGLRAMALHLGSALENARLFEEVTAARDSLEETQDQLVHAEKFAAVGVLAAEIAHEINNPASFVISNLSVMDEYAESIAEFLDELDAFIDRDVPELAETFDELKEEYDMEYLRDDMDSLLSRSLSGMQRIHQIVQDLRYLSREQGEEPGWVELEGLLDATVNLVRHEAKFRAEIERDYGDIPQVMSDSSRLSQVFLNLLMNAVQAIETGDVEDNYVRIATAHDDESVVVTIEDSGEGIPPEVEDRIFDAFYTTKETGEGTGLGLSISRDIVRSLGGEIDYDSEPGEGTTFWVRIPIRAAKFEEDRDLRDSGYYDTPPGLDDISDEIFET